MQSEPRRASPDTSNQQPVTRPPNQRQHGLRYDADSSYPSPSLDGEYGAYEGSTSEWSLSSASGGSPTEGFDSWLNPAKWDAHQQDPEHHHEATRYIPDDDASIVETSRLLMFPEELLFHVISHLPANDLLNIKLVSRRFYHLVNSPHAWMNAFARFFLGPDSLKVTSDALVSRGDVARSNQRVFTRLTSTTSWSGEYLRRTKLLRCLVRGKPALPFAAPVPGRPDKGMGVFTFSSRLGLESSHLHADWGNAFDKRKPLFIHGFSGTGNVTCSDRKGKFDSWGITDRNMFRSFAREHPGSAMYGAGQGYIIGTPNVMDVSQGYGMVHSECTPGGNAYFIGQDQKRGKNLAKFMNFADEQCSQPKINHAHQCATAVWIAKASAIPRVSNGLVGLLTGSSCGVVSAYSLGPAAKRDQRFDRGELTSRWMLSPGVPIVALAIDEDFSDRRLRGRRVWAVALNALGEVFYLTEMPKQATLGRGGEDDLDERLERRAWQTGASIHWGLIRSTRRAAKNEEMHDQVAPSFLPSSMWTEHADDSATYDVSNYHRWLSMTPAEMQATFEGWNMRRSIQVDFGGDDGNGAGEHVAVVSPGLFDDNHAESGFVTRHTRCIHPEKPSADLTSDQASKNLIAAWAFAAVSGEDGPSKINFEWHRSVFDFARYRTVTITATSLDNSIFAVNTADEDEALRSSADSEKPTSIMPGQRARLLAVGTGLGSVFLWNMRGPISSSPDLTNELDPVRIIHTASPGITSLAVSALIVVHGGADGLIQAWDPLGSTLEPLRTLTSQKSLNNRRRLIMATRANPQVQISGISPRSFAATNIILDPDPTILRGVAAVGGWLRYWSFSSASPDSDLTKAQKRKLNRGARGLATNSGESFTGTRRVGLKGFVEQEMALRDIDRKENIAYAREQRRVAHRFGLELLGEDASEEEMLAYAKMLSEEDHQKRLQRSLQERLPADATPDEVEAHRLALSEEDQQRWKYASWEERREMPTSESRLLSQLSSPQLAAQKMVQQEQLEMDDDLRRAMELSMLDSGSTPKATSPGTPAEEESDPYLAEAIRQSLASSPPAAGPSHRLKEAQSEDDLAVAMRLSMQENANASSPPSSFLPGRFSNTPSPWASPQLNGQRRESSALSDNEFPALSSSPARSPPNRSTWGKGKGKGGSAWD